MFDNIIKWIYRFSIHIQIGFIIGVVLFIIYILIKEIWIQIILKGVDNQGMYDAMKRIPLPKEHPNILTTRIYLPTYLLLTPSDTGYLMEWNDKDLYGNFRMRELVTLLKFFPLKGSTLIPTTSFERYYTFTNDIPSFIQIYTMWYTAIQKLPWDMLCAPLKEFTDQLRERNFVPLPGSLMNTAIDIDPYMGMKEQTFYIACKVTAERDRQKYKNLKSYCNLRVIQCTEFYLEVTDPTRSDHATPYFIQYTDIHCISTTKNNAYAKEGFCYLQVSFDDQTMYKLPAMLILDI